MTKRKEKVVHARGPFRSSDFPYVRTKWNIVTATYDMELRPQWGFICDSSEGNTLFYTLTYGRTVSHDREAQTKAHWYVTRHQDRTPTNYAAARQRFEKQHGIRIDDNDMLPLGDDHTIRLPCPLPILSDKAYRLIPDRPLRDFFRSMLTEEDNAWAVRAAFEYARQS